MIAVSDHVAQWVIVSLKSEANSRSFATPKRTVEGYLFTYSFSLFRVSFKYYAADKYWLVLHLEEGRKRKDAREFFTSPASFFSSYSSSSVICITLMMIIIHDC